MAERKVIDEGSVLLDDQDLKIIYEGQVIILDANSGPPPEPPTDASVPWMSFF